MNKSYLNSVRNTLLSSKPSKAIRLLLMVLFVSSFANVVSAQGVDCANATSLTINGACDNGNISDTSQNTPNISGCPAGTFRREGWYTFTVSGGSLDVTITGVTSNRNLFLQLISSTGSCTGLSQINCANDETNNNSAQTETISTTLSNGIYYIKVVYAGTSNSDMALSSICVTAVPTISSFTPNNGCSNSTSVVITGTNFTGVTGVTFGGTNAASYVVNSSTQITAIPAAGTTGAIRVITTGGTVTSGSSFTVNTAPTITTQPTALTICENTGGSFNVAASGASTYQWQYSADNINWINIDASLAPYVAGYTTATFTLSNTPAAWTNNYVRCAVWSSGGCRTNSSSVLLTVSPILSAPTIGIITQPTCSTATGSVVLSGLPIGSWALTRSPGGVTTTGTGTSTIISGLVAGTTYTYLVDTANNGTGLKGEYFNNMTLSGSPTLTRIDATVNFNWGGVSPDASINSDGFSVRWSGLVQPLYSQTYTFSTSSDDGIRLWVNGVQIINNWTNHGVVTNTGTISLTAGVKYSIVLEFYENGGDAVSTLSWSSPSQGLQIIPTTQLFPSGSCASPASANIVINAQPAIPTTPTGTVTQSFCSGATVANLLATGTNIQWYAASSGGIPLASTTVLANGIHYYASQNPSGCESATRFDVTATVNATPTITGIVTPTTCTNSSDGAVTITGLNVPIEFKKTDNDYIDLGSPFLSNKSAFTVEGWVKFNLADVGSRMSLFGQNDVIEFYLNTNTIELWTPNSGVITTPITAGFGNNAWHHIAATGDGTSTKIYIDGVLAVTGSGAANYGTSAYNTQIGNGVVDPLIPTGGGFTGQIKKVGFYNTALSAGTISSLATNPVTYLGTEAGIITGYNFSEGSGTTLTSLPAGKNGAFGNSPQWVYTYAWTKIGAPAYVASTKDISGLSTGDYNLTVSTLGVSCPVTKTFTVGYANSVPSIPIVGTITQPDCVTATGSVVLSGLPVGGILNPGNISYSGTSYTFTGLIPNSYNFTVSNGTCNSSATGNVVINASTIAVWNGTSWTNGPPTASQALEFLGNYSSSGDLTACSCKVTGGKTVTINSGHTLTITNEVTVLGTGVGAGILTFEDKASLVQINYVVNSGDIIYKRTTSSVLASDYTYWSSPVANQNLSISPSYTSGMFFSYNDFAVPEDWKSETATSVMLTGKGYIIRGPQITGTPPPPGFYSATFKGVPNNGTKTIAIGSAGTSSLLGNPYPSAISADLFLAANSTLVEGTIYFWTHKTAIQLASNIASGKAGSGVLAYTSDDYASYNGTGGVAVVGGVVPNGKIAAGQAFFTTSLGAGTVTFNNAMRLAGTTLSDVTGVNQQFFKTKNTNTKTANTIEKNRVWLNLANAEGAFKQTLVGYITDATNEYDRRFDGESFDGNEFVDFYSINQDKNLVIQGRALPFDENDEVPLGYRTAIEGVFTINIDQLDGALTNQAVFIEDKLTNTVFNLKNGNYTFNTVAGTFNDRFVLRYTNKTLGAGEFHNEINQVVVLVKNKQIRINSFAETIDKVEVYDLSGRLIYKKEKVNDGELLITNFVSSHQTLLVKTILQSGKMVTDKIIL